MLAVLDQHGIWTIDWLNIKSDGAEGAMFRCAWLLGRITGDGGAVHS